MAHAYLPSGEGETLWFAGQQITYKVRGREGGATIFELTVGPHGGAPAHLHRTQDETHYIMGGCFRFHCAGDTFLAERGAVVHVPKGVPHGFTNVSSATGTILCVETHPGPLEAFFDDLGETTVGTPSLPPRPMTMQMLLSAARRTGGLELLVPGLDTSNHVRSSDAV